VENQQGRLIEVFVTGAAAWAGCRDCRREPERGANVLPLAAAVNH